MATQSNSYMRKKGCMYVCVHTFIGWREGRMEKTVHDNKMRNESDAVR